MKLDIQIHIEELQRRITSHLRSCIENNERDRIIKICGISGTGKTQLALSFAQNTKCSMYFSFRGLDNRTALAQFKRTFSVWCDLSSAMTWKEAVQCLVPFFKKHYTRIVLDDLEHSKSESEVIAAIEQLSESLTDMKNLFLLPCRCESSFGNHRLSEIAKHMDVPNNQCKKYLDALIVAGLIAVKKHHYSILNSYVDFWHRFFYPNASKLVTTPYDVANDVQSQLDEFTLEKQLPECIKKLPFHIPKDAKRQYNAVFDFVFQSGSHTVLIKLPESLDWHCTKQELDTLMDSVTDYCNAFYKAEICVVSFNRFSNYCVKQSGQLDNLHLVVG